MIDSAVFKASRDAARAKLDAEVARDSFGYFIDIANEWETYRSPEEMLNYMGIHKTHEAQFPEIAMDLGPLSDEEVAWARRYVEFFNRLARMVATTGYRPEFQFDLAETAFDWRNVRSFIDLPARILDFGAGSGRQCVSAFLHNSDNIYAAVDATLAAYTLQNLVFSFMDAMLPEAKFIDYLDLETARLPYPDISNASAGDRFHIPGWFEADPLPARFFDVILACHVHNELSKWDFMRLMNAVVKGLSDDGIFYVRSELGVRFPKNYFDTLDMHAIDMVTLLREHDIVPVFCKYECAFQTTVFARKGSSHYEKAMASEIRETDFTEIENSTEMSIRAGQHFTTRNMEWAGKTGKRTAILGHGFDIYFKLIEPGLDLIPDKLIFTEAEAMASDKAFKRKVKDFLPDVILATGSDFFAAARNAVEATGIDYAITVHHIMPTCFTLREFQKQPAPILAGQEIRYIGDIEKILRIEDDSRHLVGSEIFGRSLA